MTEQLTASAHNGGSETDDDLLLVRVRRSFEEVVSGPTVPLFTTDADLWPLFLDSIPPEKRQEYTCGACQTFVERFGGLATLEEDGKGPRSVFWREVEPRTPTFDRACAALAAAVSRASVTGVFLSKAETWGKPVTGAWQHFAVTPPAALLHRHLTLTPEQLMAERREDFDILSRALERYPLKLVRNAHQILSTGDHLYRAEKVLGVAAWLLALQERLKGIKDKRRRERIVWRAVATAPPGFAHVNTTMIGTLLEDLAEALPFAEVSRRFAQKMHPLQYQRPTAGPSATQIAQAEKAVAALRAAGALERRFARLDDVEALWKPASSSTLSDPSGAGGVFQHLKPKKGRSSATDVEAPAATFTWEKFRRTVLPDAQEIEVYVSPGRIEGIALTTATHPGAQPILQWDREDRRNPVSWYVYHGGGTARDWNLSPASWVQVVAICLLPPMWGRETPQEHHGLGAILLLDGARDMRWTEKGGGMGFFPEQLRTELHPFRKTLEAYAQQATVAGGNESMAAGIDLRKGGDWHGVKVRVTSRNGRSLYVLDRWD